MDLTKIPTYKDKVKKILGLDETKDKLVICQGMSMEEGMMLPLHSMFRDDLLLHNCMLDSNASSNVMSLKVMNQLGLQITWPYRNVCAMDCRKIKVHGLTKDLQVKLASYLDISLLMDVVVIDVLDAWGMLFSRKCTVSLGGILYYTNRLITCHHSHSG